MAKAKFYVAFVQKKEGATHDQVKEKMNLANDWFMIKSDLWVLYSTSTPQKWHERFDGLIKEDGRFFICELNVSNRQGWMGKSFWAWLKEDRSSK